MMNGYPKYIVSTTLEEAGWNNSTIIKGNIADEVFRLKQQPGNGCLDLRQWRSREHADTTRPHRRVSDHGLSNYRGERKVPLQGRERNERYETRGYEDVRFGRRCPYLPADRRGSGGIMTYVLWIVQGLLALLFLFTGGIKLVLPIEVMTEQMPVPLPGPFLRFIGVAEVLGAVGLILPWLLGIRLGLTPLAAAGLVIIMTGAMVLTLAGVVPGGVAGALIPLVVGLLSAFVAYGRWRLTPHRGSTGSRNV